ncbi:Transposase [Methylorubrum populi]
MPETNVGGWQGPPAGFGLQWQAPRELKVGGVPKALWTAEAPSQDYDDALAGPEGRSLRNVGFAYDRHRGNLPCFWEGVDHNPWQVECLVNTAVRGLDAYRAKAARERTERAEREALAAATVARRAAEDLALAERAIAAARESLRTQAWAWAVRDDVETAERRIARGPHGMERYQSEHLLDLVKRAKDNVDRAMAAMQIPYEPESERAADPAVQAAAHEGCRLLTARDADRAGIRNQSGWGKTTTTRGHILAGLPALDATLASHALRALRTHRKQLPRDLELRVFGHEMEDMLAEAVA